MRKMKNNNKSVITVDLNDPVKSLEYLEEAFQIGTFILKNSPVNFKRLAKVLSDLDTFYNLDFKTKIEISGQISGGGATRGYFPLGVESGLVDVFEKRNLTRLGGPIMKFQIQIPQIYH